MRRPAFTVVSSSVAALVVLGFATQYMRPKIPKAIENELGQERSEFLNRAVTQKINWQKPTVESFALARRRDLPILLFIGSSYNPLARGLDAGVLQSPHVQAFLARNFECIRVDTLDYPEFRNAFLPLYRAKIGLPTGCQLWVLDPSGKIIDLLPKGLALNPTDESAFISALVQARQRFEQPTQAAALQLEAAQGQDVRMLLEPPLPTTPPFAEYGAGLADAVYEKGGFGKEDARSLVPEAWRYLLATGKTDAFKASIDPVLMSPLCDLIDGGFFQGCRDTDWVEVDFDKSAVVNADMLQLLASAWTLLGDPLYRYLAESAFDCLANEFVVSNGIAACRASDAGESMRSMRSSFGVRKLREVLANDSDYQWAQKQLGLRVEENPRMSPHIARLDTLDQRDRLERVLSVLRKGTGKKPECTSTGLADVTGYCVARMMESARILDDSARMKQAVDLFSWVEENRDGSTILHSNLPDIKGAYLGDYLSYADAALQHYLVTGRYTSLQSGRQVLLKALETFAGPRPGILELGPERKAPLPTSLSLPEICDPAIESVTAQAIRLCQSYGRIFPKDAAFRQYANSATQYYGTVAGILGIRGAGFFVAAQEVMDDAFFVSVGPEAQAWADQLAHLHPHRLSLAAFGDIRTDLTKRGSGTYVVRGELIRGPMTPQQAAKLVSPFLGPDQ